MHAARPVYQLVPPILLVVRPTGGTADTSNRRSTNAHAIVVARWLQRPIQEHSRAIYVGYLPAAHSWQKTRATLTDINAAKFLLELDVPRRVCSCLIAKLQADICDHLDHLGRWSAPSGHFSL